MERRDSFAIIVEDYYMGKALGKNSYLSGKTGYINEKLSTTIQRVLNKKNKLKHVFTQINTILRIRQERN